MSAKEISKEKNFFERWTSSSTKGLGGMLAALKEYQKGNIGVIPFISKLAYAFSKAKPSRKENLGEPGRGKNPKGEFAKALSSTLKLYIKSWFENVGDKCINNLNSWFKGVNDDNLKKLVKDESAGKNWMIPIIVLKKTTEWPAELLNELMKGRALDLSILISLKKQYETWRQELSKKLDLDNHDKELIEKMSENNCFEQEETESDEVNEDEEKIDEDEKSDSETLQQMLKKKADDKSPVKVENDTATLNINNDISEENIDNKKKTDRTTVGLNDRGNYGIIRYHLTLGFGEQSAQLRTFLSNLN